MTRNITITFSDGSNHVYRNAPDNVTPEQVTARASQDFGKPVAHIDGGRTQETEQANNVPQVGSSADHYDGSGATVGNLANAAWQSVYRGLPAALENGAAVVGRSLSGDSPRWQALSNRAQENRKEIAENYQHPSGVDPSITHALRHGGLSGAIRSLGYSAAENLGPTGATIGAALVPYAGLPLAAAIGGTEAADNVSQEKKAAGLQDADRLNGMDALNVGAQAVLNATPLKIKPGGMIKGALPLVGHVASAPGPVARGMLNTASEATKGAVGSFLDQSSIHAQGGDVGSPSDVLQNIADAALTRGAVAGLPLAPKAAAGTAKVLDRTHMRYLTSFGKGLSEYQEGIKAGKPLSAMSDNAKIAIATLDRGEQQVGREAGQTGASNAAVTANGELGTTKVQLENIRDALKANPQANGVTASPSEFDRVMSEAIREATNHNMRIAPETEGNSAPSAQQRLKLMLPDELFRPIEARLNTADLMSQDRLQNKSKAITAPAMRGFMGRAAPIAMAGIGIETGHPIAGAIGAGLAGAASSLGHRAANSLVDRVGHSVDNMFGLGTPPSLRRINAKMDLADSMGYQPRQVGEQLSDIEAAAKSASNRAAVRQAQVRQARTAPQMAQTAPPSAPQTNGTVTPQPPTAPAPESPIPQQSYPDRKEPVAHSAAEIVGQRIPGWAATTSQNYGVSPTEIMSFLSNRLADRQITPEQYAYLTTTDHIGDNMQTLQREIGALKHVGLWDKMSNFRDPNAKKTLAAMPSTVDTTLGKNGVPQKGINVDYDGNQIRNQASYQGEINREADTAQAILRNAPELLTHVMAIRAGKTPKARKEILAQRLAKIPDQSRAEAELTMLPLTAFGYKGSKEMKRD